MKASLEFYKKWKELIKSDFTTQEEIFSHVEEMNTAMHRLEVVLYVQNARVATLEDALSQCLSGKYKEDFQISELLKVKTVGDESTEILKGD